MRGDESKRTHHVLIRMGEWRRSQEFVDFVVDFGEDVEEGKKSLMIIEREWLNLLC